MNTEQFIKEVASVGCSDDEEGKRWAQAYENIMLKLRMERQELSSEITLALVSKILRQTHAIFENYLSAAILELDSAAVIREREAKCVAIKDLFARIQPKK